MPVPINLGARLVVRVDAAGSRTRVCALAVVQEALSRKPALLQLTDTLARRFVITLLLAAPRRLRSLDGGTASRPA